MRELRVALGVFMCAVIAEARPVKPEMARPMKVQSAAAKTISVDCTKGQSIQDAVDKNAGPVTIEVDGICVENVRIERKTVTLRGDDPLTDGLQGVSSTAPGSLSIYHSNDVVIENLSFINGPTAGVSALSSIVFLTNCRVTGNATSGMAVTLSSFVQATELTASNNFRGALVHRSGSFFCIGCTFTNNTRFAATASTGAILSLLDSVVTGLHGVSASFQAYADIDCVTEVSAYPCSMNVTGVAVQTTSGGEAGLYGAGDFTGRLFADDHGQTFVFGSRQLGTSGNNAVDSFGTLWVMPLEDENAVVQQSRISRPTNVSGFARMLVREASVLDGSVACDSAGDAWLDPTVTTGVGVTVTGCEHASVP